ncbi:MAG: threonine synthase [Candidatus Electrothrix aestuarii]|uniref:Threonine synthase n=1 Tax=Candidatus Electrothrix aestuarii TaxID=3062594 RepID=A0AAU8M2B4_9BACT|nr:threonine synthase [Candidatus Electrothrix aestuarii]
MKYISTRGGIEPITFDQAVMMGLARDGGLLLPETLPSVSEQKLEAWKNLSYQHLALEVLDLFTGDMPRDDLEDLIERAYSSFRHPHVTPVRKTDDLYILELFHGPTLAFKDVALQLLGNLFEYELKKSGGFMNIIGATSGDTGSAAIYGVRGRKGINIFILHPHGRTSPIQALQMTTVTDENVFNLAVNGTFDDAQAIVKKLFSDLEFKDTYQLGAINSINWARVLAQVVYYVFAFLKLRKQGFSSVDFSVPTGNFGDIFAGYVAKKLLPEGCIKRLILATNSNDILTRFVNKGDYSIAGDVTPTYSPSMDIQIASNFERYLYYLHGQDGAKVKADMETFAATGSMDLSAFHEQASQDFVSRSVSEEETITTIREYYQKHEYLLDPHTAVGVRAAQELREDRPVVCLSTAHPAKFGEAVRKATGNEVELPSILAGLAEKESRCEILDADIALIREYVEKNALEG